MNRCRPAILTALILLSACTASKPHTSSASSPVSPAPPPALPSGVSATVVVFADSVLKPAFDKLAAQFEAANPGASVTVTYQGSQALATAIRGGAQADVFAGLTTDVGLLSGSGSAVTPTAQAFASDTYEIVVPVGNPRGLQSLGDLAGAGRGVVLVDPSLPAGRDSARILTLAGVKVTPKSVEPSTASVLGKVEGGMADAGIVYASDVVAAGQTVAGVAIAAAQNVTETFGITLLHSNVVPGPQAFVSFVLSSQGQATLRGLGFK